MTKTCVSQTLPVRAASILRGLSSSCRADSHVRPRWRVLHNTRCVATVVTDRLQSLHVPTIPNERIPFPVGSVDGKSRREALKKAKPFSEFLTDNYNRQHDYLRISITERCNLRCLYCMPEEGVSLSPPAHLLTTPEIFYLSSLFVSQGVTKIRLTGGEPTVRRDILPLMRQIGTLRSKGLREIALTTNGLLLHRKLDAMVEAGLTGVNMSLDTLDPFQFQIMTRRKGFDAVMRSIDRILEMNKLGAGIKLKINCVVMRGMNEREILPFVEMGREKDIEVRFIEYMPFGGNKWSKGKMLSYKEMLDMIREKYPDVHRVQGHQNDTSKTYKVPGFVGRIGFITSMTEDFCGSCNRLRVTGDGNLKVCLHGNAEVSLRDMLREGNAGRPIDEEAFEALKQLEINRNQGRLPEGTTLGWGERERKLLDIIGIAVKRKKEKHAGMGELENMENRPMILIDDPKSFLASHQVDLRGMALSTSRLEGKSNFSSRHWASVSTHILSTSPRALSRGASLRLYSTKDVNGTVLGAEPPGDPDDLDTMPGDQSPYDAIENAPQASSDRQDKDQSVPRGESDDRAEWDILKDDEGDPFAKARQLMKQIDRDEVKKTIRIIDRYAYILERYTIPQWRKKIYAIVWNIGPKERKSPEFEILIVGREELARSIKLRLEKDRIRKGKQDTEKSSKEQDEGKSESEGLAESIPRIRWRHRERRLRMAREQYKLEMLEKRKRRALLENPRLQIGATTERDIAECQNYELDQTLGISQIESLANQSSLGQPHLVQRFQAKNINATQFAGKNSGSRQFSTQARRRKDESRPTQSEDPSTAPDDLPFRKYPFSESIPPTKLTHLNEFSEVHMVDVGAKKPTHRTAIAIGSVQFGNPQTYSLVKEARLKKGDVLSVARVAGIMAAKNCPLIIPLCHPISITGSSVDLKLFSASDGINSVPAPEMGVPPSDHSHGGISVQATVKCYGPTGVEMEALTAVSGACLTIIDMIKAVDREAVIGQSQVVLKTGGRSGDSGNWAAETSTKE